MCEKFIVAIECNSFMGHRISEWNFFPFLSDIQWILLISLYFLPRNDTFAL